MTRPDSGARVKTAVAVLAAVAVGLVANTSTWSAWSTETHNAGNRFVPGAVVLGTNAAGSSMFDTSAMPPGATTERCVRVLNAGTLPSTVRLYGEQATSTGLQPYLRLTVTRGTGSVGFGGCGGFTPDRGDHAGLGAGVLYRGLMSAYPADWASGIADPDTPWAVGTTHDYRFSVQLVDDNDAQGKAASEKFTWEAHQ
jgi:hypothetical protein